MTQLQMLQQAVIERVPTKLRGNEDQVLGIVERLLDRIRTLEAEADLAKLGKLCIEPHDAERLSQPRDGYNDNALRPY